MKAEISCEITQNFTLFVGDIDLEAQFIRC